MNAKETVRQMPGVKKFFYFPAEIKPEEMEQELEKEETLKRILLETIPFIESEREQPVHYFSFSSGNNVIIVVKNSGNTGAVTADENANIGLLKVMMNRVFS